MLVRRRPGSNVHCPHRRSTNARRRGLVGLGLVLWLAASATAEPGASAADATPPIEAHVDGTGGAPVEVEPAAWVRTATRMVYLTPGEVDQLAPAGAQVAHFNLVWPYFPLRRDGGGLNPDEARALAAFVEACHRQGVRAVLGLPPFPPAALVRAHPEWRVDADGSGSVLAVEPRDDDLGTRLGCNQGPWGDYLIELVAELAADYGLDGFSFDGNYHAPLCHCPSCRESYPRMTGRPLPARIDLNDLDYRRYLVWRGERLEAHYQAMQQRLKRANPQTAIITWTVNAGRYGHLLTSPRVMSTRMNRLFDAPMQEWWLDETNLGASVAPAFGAAYIRAVAGDRPAACEPYLMSRGNPYGPDSFPRFERLARSLLVVTHGSWPSQLLSWHGGSESTGEIFAAVKAREPWLVGAADHPWVGLLVSEQTRQFYAYGNIPERFLAHVFGAFRGLLEEHLPVTLLCDWDLEPARLSRYRVLVLPNAAALSDAQLAAVRQYVERGGGLVATCETSLCDELGRPRADFGLADVLGVSYRGRPAEASEPAALDANFAIALDEGYWQKRSGIGRIEWGDHPLLDDARLADLVPSRSVRFKGPLVEVSPRTDPAAVAARYAVGDAPVADRPAIVSHTVGKGRVVYLAAGLDAALWSYAYPYQRRILARAIRVAAGGDFPLEVSAPPCVQATFFEPPDAPGRLVVQLYNGLDPSAGHGQPGLDVPLREAAVPLAGLALRFAPGRFHKATLQPQGQALALAPSRGAIEVALPPLELHYLVVLDP